MEPEITLTLGVFRRFDNGIEGQNEDPQRALEFHNRRRAALHEALDGKSLVVTAWGDTDDTDAHEYVELLLGAAGSAVFSYAIVPGLKFLGEKLAEAAVDHATSEAVKAVVSWLRPKQEEKKLLDFVITLPDGATINVAPPDGGGTITVSFKNGRVETLKYSAGNVDAG